MQFSSSFNVDASKTIAFDYLADGAHALPFHPRGTTMVQEPGGEIALGTRFVFDRPDGLEYSSTISRFERPDRLEFESAFGERSPSVASWQFSELGPRTRLTVDTQSGFVGPRWMKPFVGILTLVAWPLMVLKMWRLKRRLTSSIEAAGQGAT
jgi:hypothetical protein